jgi:iron complex outermembrane receptor protein
MNFLKDKMPANMPMNTEVHTFSTALRLEFPVSRHETLRLGGEYHHQWLNDYWPPVAGSMMMGPNTYLNVNAAHRNRLGRSPSGSGTGAIVFPASWAFVSITSR